MTQLQSRLVRKLTAISIPILLASFLWLIAISPAINAFADQNDQVAEGLKAYSGFVVAAAQEPALKVMLRELNGKSLRVGGFLEGDNPDVAVATLQSEIGIELQNRGAEIKSAQSLPPTRDHGFQRISYRYDLNARYADITKLIYLIESHTPYLFIDDVEMNAEGGWQDSQADVTNTNVSMALTFHAYRRLP